MHTTLPTGIWRRKVLLALVSLSLLVSLFASDLLWAQQKYLYDDFFAVCFPDGKSGWTCGRWGAVFHTTDGGTTWEKQVTPVDYTLSGIAFADTQNGWAVGDEGAIIHTADGGKTWEQQKSPVPYFLMDVYFLNAQKGWIVTEQTTILHTEDGGATWAIQFQDQDFILKAIDFSDELNGWAVGEYGYIYHTTDGGATWVNQAGLFDISDEDGSIIAGNFLFDVDAIDNNTVWAAGIDSYVTRTDDGGNTWVEVKTGLSKTHLFSVLAPSKSEILLGGNGVLICSSDSGQTWTKPEFKPHILYSWIYDVAAISPDTFLAVGREGIIYRGNLQTWEQISY